MFVQLCLASVLQITSAALPPIALPGIQCPHGEVFMATKSEGQSVAACDFINENDGMLRGVAADGAVVVVPQPIRMSPMGPLPPRVLVYSRVSGNLLGELPAPAGGFKTPFGAKFLPNGKLMVIDIGPFTNDVNASFAGFLAEYTKSGTSFALSRVVSFAGSGAGFIADCDPVPGNQYVCADQIGGNLFVVAANGSVSVGVGAPGAPPGLGIPALQLGVRPPGEYWDFSRYPNNTPLAFTPVPAELLALINLFSPVPFPEGSTFVPGANYLSYYAGNGEVYWFNVNQQAFFAIPLSVLTNNQDPMSRAAHIHQVATVSSMPFADGTTDTKAIIGAMTFKRGDPTNPWLYMPDPMRARVLRLNVLTGEWVVVLSSVELFDSPSNIQFSSNNELWVCSDQEEGLGFLNSALTPPPGWPPMVPYTDFRGTWKVTLMVMGSE